MIWRELNPSLILTTGQYLVAYANIYGSVLWQIIQYIMLAIIYDNEYRQIKPSWTKSGVLTQNYARSFCFVVSYGFLDACFVFVVVPYQSMSPISFDIISLVLG